MELPEAEGVEGRKAVNGPKVCAKGGVTPNPGGADDPREPGEVERPIVTAEVESGKSVYESGRPVEMN